MLFQTNLLALISGRFHQNFHQIFFLVYAVFVYVIRLRFEWIRTKCPFGYTIDIDICTYIKIVNETTRYRSKRSAIVLLYLNRSCCIEFVVSVMVHTQHIRADFLKVVSRNSIKYAHNCSLVVTIWYVNRTSHIRTISTRRPAKLTCPTTTNR